MTDVNEMAGVGLASEQKVEDEERKCPACGKTWTKTEPTLAQVRKAIQEEICRFEQPIHRLEPSAEVGYRGSVARGTVGNPGKPHYNYEPDIRGECGVGFDVDGFMLSETVYSQIKPDKFKKRWAARLGATRQIESQMRAALKGRAELAHMKPGKDGFELLVRHFSERQKVFDKGGVIILIHSA